MSTENRPQHMQKLNSKKSQNQYDVKKRIFSKQNSSCEIMLFNSSKTINSNSNTNNSRLSRGLAKGHSLENLGLPTRLSHPQKYSSFAHNTIGKEKQQQLASGKTSNTDNNKNTNHNNNSNNSNNKDAKDINAITLSKNKQFSMPNKNIPYARTSTNSGTNKINLNIILPQTVVPITETDLYSSDIDSSSEATPDNTNHISRVKIKPNIISNLAQNPEPNENKNRRTPNLSITKAEFNENCENLVNTSATMVSRPPLVRAMSAPVRSMHDNLKSILPNGKRKPRRRKVPVQNCNEDTKLETWATSVTALESRLICGKKVYTRSRSVAVSDVETFVSLMSSDGSESEKEDSSCLHSRNDLFGGRLTRRAPSLKKTGKSVSFQETSCYQLTNKDYSHILRRGSVVPLVARLRANRPPTAPAGSLFHRNVYEADNNTTLGSSGDKPPQMESQEKNVPSHNNDNFPAYVSSIKERECWKLFQKMSDKGISVSFETILRGMLTPTEFRQSQKQRELEEEKAQLLQEEASDSANSYSSPSSSTSSSSASK